MMGQQDMMRASIAGNFMGTNQFNMGASQYGNMMQAPGFGQPGMAQPGI